AGDACNRCGRAVGPGAIIADALSRPVRGMVSGKMSRSEGSRPPRWAGLGQPVSRKILARTGSQPHTCENLSFADLGLGPPHAQPRPPLDPPARNPDQPTHAEPFRLAHPAPPSPPPQQC